MVADGALVERALDALIRKGKVPGGKAYGYDLVTAATGERQINPAPAASGQANQQLLADLDRGLFDVVVVEARPVAAVTRADRF